MPCTMITAAVRAGAWTASAVGLTAYVASFGAMDGVTDSTGEIRANYRGRAKLWIQGKTGGYSVGRCSQPAGRTEQLPPRTRAVVAAFSKGPRYIGVC